MRHPSCPVAAARGGALVWLVTSVRPQMLREIVWPASCVPTPRAITLEGLLPTMYPYMLCEVGGVA